MLLDYNLIPRPFLHQVLDRLQYVSLMFSISACLIFVANTERSVMTCDACATDHVVTASPLHTASDQGRPGNEAN